MNISNKTEFIIAELKKRKLPYIYDGHEDQYYIPVESMQPVIKYLGKNNKFKSISELLTDCNNDIYKQNKANDRNNIQNIQYGSIVSLKNIIDENNNVKNNN